MKIVSRTAVAVVALAAAGCTNLPGGSLLGTFSAESYLGQEIGGSDFNAALAREYQKLAAVNAETDVNWLDSTVYIERSKAAAAGSPPELFQPAALGVNSDAEAKRAEVLNAVAANAGTRPAECAAAAAAYDRYVESLYQAPGLNPEVARANLDSAITACTGVAAGDLVVYFGFNRADLTEAAQSVIGDVVAAVQGTGRQISLVGHTDTVGGLQYNQRLSERRANAVKNRMVQLGIPAGDITTAGRSWTEPAVDTGPNVREPLNRRVEIAVSE
jgi:outer membrane protein OmpA-like peptidoglycan-associated protein